MGTPPMWATKYMGFHVTCAPIEQYLSFSARALLNWISSSHVPWYIRRGAFGATCPVDMAERAACHDGRVSGSGPFTKSVMRRNGRNPDVSSTQEFFANVTAARPVSLRISSNGTSYVVDAPIAARIMMPENGLPSRFRAT